ncbi:MAG: hypothetical protein CMJ58_12780 [Planctomycetaceae bacterium]|nr:hypothetical protein [Planctomycetaceae bacterium]
MNNDGATAIELAYGLLWLQITQDTTIHDARKLVGAGLPTQAKARGIQRAKELYGEPDIRRIINDE